MTASSHEEAEERRTGPARPRLELRVVLGPDEERMPIEFHYLAALTGLVLAHVLQTRLLDLLDEVWIDLVAVPVTLVDVISPAVQPAHLAVID